MKELSLTDSNIGDASCTLTYITVPYYIFVNSNHQVYSNFYESNIKWTRTINPNTTIYRKDLLLLFYLEVLNKMAVIFQSILLNHINLLILFLRT